MLSLDNYFMAAGVVKMLGMWDATLQRKLVAFVGLMALFGIAYVGALMTGLPIVVRLFV